jgi:hypothetical protein
MRLQMRLAQIGDLFLAVFTAGTTAFMLVGGWRSLRNGEGPTETPNTIRGPRRA